MVNGVVEYARGQNAQYLIFMHSGSPTHNPSLLTMPNVHYNKGITFECLFCHLSVGLPKMLALLMHILQLN